jgi:hypothetical protein
MTFVMTFRSVWLWSLAFFVLAAITGFLYRFGMLYSLPADLSLSNIRHAHSHLMFFTWVTPVPMLFIAGYITNRVPEAAASFKKCLYSVLIVGFASFPFFLFYGYMPVPVGPAELPFSTILSGLAMITWYWFIRIYLKHREKSEPGIPRMFYDAGLLLLFISSLGAWGVAVYQFGDIDNPLLSTATTHFFLAVFTGGWCVLSAFGIIYQIMGISQVQFHESWLLAPIVLGVPLTFPFGMPVDLLNNQLLISAIFGAIIVVLGLAVNLYIMARQVWVTKVWWWIIALNLLGATILMLFGGAVFPFIFWIGEHGLRVFYLHVLLLGFVSITYLGAWHTLNPLLDKKAFKMVTLTILLLLAMLLLSSGLVPPAWLPAWHFQALTWISLLPAVAVLLECVTNWKVIDQSKL